MRKKLIALAVAACFVAQLVGCAQAPIVRTIEVKVPVPVPCDAPEIKRPEYALDSAPDDDDVYELTRAALAEIEQRKAYEIRLESALNSCRKLEKN